MEVLFIIAALVTILAGGLDLLGRMRVAKNALKKYIQALLPQKKSGYFTGNDFSETWPSLQM
jgi:hypothetical protein